MTDNAAIRPKTHRRPSLQREASFYEHVWFDLHDTLMSLGKRLVNEYGFEESDQADGLLINLHRPSEAIDSTHTTWVRLPVQLDPLHPGQMNLCIASGALNLSTGITDEEPGAISIRIHSTDLDIAPILDVVHILLSMFPSALDQYQSTSSSSGPEIADRAKWLAINEELVRETMGDSHFRHLSEAMIVA